jgi:hypothetical protein
VSLDPRGRCRREQGFRTDDASLLEGGRRKTYFVPSFVRVGARCTAEARQKVHVMVVNSGGVGVKETCPVVCGSWHIPYGHWKPPGNIAVCTVSCKLVLELVKRPSLEPWSNRHIFFYTSLYIPGCKT